AAAGRDGSQRTRPEGRRQSCDSRFTRGLMGRLSCLSMARTGRAFRGHRWCVSRKGVGADGSPRFYAARAWQEDGRQKGEMLQNFILGVKSIDHVNDDTLDNRKVNLRPATHAQNGQNNRRYGTNTSGVTGVYLDKRRGTWFA